MEAKGESSEKILYEDSYCKLTKSELTIYCYYFPFGLPKSIPLDEIERLSTPEGEGLDMWGVKGWGMALSDIWWACDMTRFNICKKKFRRTCCLVTVKDETTRKGFSVERPQELFPILKGPFLADSNTELLKWVTN